MKNLFKLRIIGIVGRGADSLRKDVSNSCAGSGKTCTYPSTSHAAKQNSALIAIFITAVRWF